MALCRGCGMPQAARGLISRLGFVEKCVIGWAERGGDVLCEFLMVDVEFSNFASRKGNVQVNLVMTGQYHEKAAP